MLLWQARGWLQTDLVGKEEGHPGPITAVLGDVAKELQHGCDAWKTVAGQLAPIPSAPVPSLWWINNLI